MEHALAAAPVDYSMQNRELALLVARAQEGSEDATEELLERFRPLLRARMHWLWQAVREEPTSLEWNDIEAQVNALFLMRLQAFRLEEGVFFPHYIARLLDLDARDWLRKQRRAHATPFSQLALAHEHSDDLDFWMDEREQACSIVNAEADDQAERLDETLAMREALHVLSPAQREVIHLCYERGLSEASAAQRLDVSRSAVRNRLAGAIERLRGFFQSEESEGVALVEGGTRTGRASSVASSLQHWVWRLEMAKDDRRPDLVGVGAGRPVMLQGVFDFPATGLKTPQLLSPRLRYVVPAGCVAGIRFMRVGVTCDSMVCVSTVVNGMPHRLIPVAPNSATHVPFAIVEPLLAGSEVEIHVASDKEGTAVIDVGCLEMPG